MDTGGLPDPFARTGEATEEIDPLVGRNVGGKFVLEKQLGAGAMGAVYRARQTALEKTVAIKVMHGDLARDPMFAARFHREAKAASRLDHQNSIRILDYGQDTDGLLYIAMEFLDGRDLSHLLVSEWPLSNARIVDILSQALGAIAVAHDMGITHRDLKPENIMVLRRRTDEGVDIDVVKVCDFGIAKLVDAADEGTGAPAKGKLTTAGLVIGTPAYMSPEQGRGEVIDGRSDIYSTGIILYQLLTGELPFDAPSAIGLVVKHQTEAPRPPSSVRAGVDAGLEVVCLKAIQKAPGDRFQNARELRAALRAAVDGTAPQSRSSLGSSPGDRVVVPLPTQPMPVESVTARTELQLAAVPTGAAILSTGATPVQDAGKKRSRWPVVVAGVAVVAAVVGVAVRTRGSASSISPSAPVASVDRAPVEEATRSPSPAHETPSETLARATPVVVESAVEHEASHHRERPVAAPGHALLAEPPTRPHAAVATPAVEERAPAPPEAPALPPPPVVAAPAPPPPPPVPAAPAPPAFDVTTAGVDVAGATNTQQISASRVNVTMSRVKAAIRQCYVSRLSQLSGTLDGTGTLHVETDDSGTITTASLRGPVRGSVGSCIEGSVRGERIDGVDTGSASADVPLTFRAR